MTFTTKGGTELQLLDLKGKPYLQVAHRIVWFREEKPDWIIQTEFVKLEDKMAIAKASIMDSDGKIRATAHKREDQAGFFDFMEKAETGAIGRALALLGYGTQFCADELDEGERVVDSPTTAKKTMPKLDFSQVTRTGPPVSMNVTHVGTDNAASAPRLVGKTFGGSSVASVAESVFAHGRLATEPQKKKVWAMLKSLGYADEGVKAFMVQHIGEKKTSQITFADIDKLILEINRRTTKAQ